MVEERRFLSGIPLLLLRHFGRSRLVSCIKLLRITRGKDGDKSASKLECVPIIQTTLDSDRGIIGIEVATSQRH